MPDNNTEQRKFNIVYRKDEAPEDQDKPRDVLLEFTKDGFIMRAAGYYMLLDASTIMRDGTILIHTTPPPHGDLTFKETARYDYGVKYTLIEK